MRRSTMRGAALALLRSGTDRRASETPAPCARPSRPDCGRSPRRPRSRPSGCAGSGCTTTWPGYSVISSVCRPRCRPGSPWRFRTCRRRTPAAVGSGRLHLVQPQQGRQRATLGVAVDAVGGLDLELDRARDLAARLGSGAAEQQRAGPQRGRSAAQATGGWRSRATARALGPVCARGRRPLLAGCARVARGCPGSRARGAAGPERAPAGVVRVGHRLGRRARCQAWPKPGPPTIAPPASARAAPGGAVRCRRRYPKRGGCSIVETKL